MLNPVEGRFGTMVRRRRDIDIRIVYQGEMKPFKRVKADTVNAEINPAIRIQVSREKEGRKEKRKKGISKRKWENESEEGLAEYPGPSITKLQTDRTFPCPYP